MLIVSTSTTKQASTQLRLLIASKAGSKVPGWYNCAMCGMLLSQTSTCWRSHIESRLKECLIPRSHYNMKVKPTLYCKTLRKGNNTHAQYSNNKAVVL